MHERAGGVPGELVKLGLDVEVRALWAGDYVLEELALVERKTVCDLHLTVIRGRFWLQMSIDDLGITVISSHDSAETAMWIRRIFERRVGPRTNNRTPYAQRPK